MAVIDAIKDMATRFSGKLGIYARHLQTGEIIEFNGDCNFATASCIKVPIMIEVFRQAGGGRFSLSDNLELREEDKTTGSGVLLDLTPGLKMSVRDLAHLMIAVSDNTATNMLIDLVGIESVNNTMGALGMKRTELRGKILWEILDKDNDLLGVSSPRDMAEMFALIAEKKIISPEACEEMMFILGRQQYTDMIPRYLPYSRFARQRDLAQDVLVASKSGGMKGCRNDAGHVTTQKGQFVFCGMTKDCVDQRYNEDNEASTIVAKSAKLVYDWFVS